MKKVDQSVQDRFNIQAAIRKRFGDEVIKEAQGRLCSVCIFVRQLDPDSPDSLSVCSLNSLAEGYSHAKLPLTRTGQDCLYYLRHHPLD